jgi:hypothetical protein
MTAAALAAGAPHTPRAAADAACAPIAADGVVRLAGTPHLFVCGDDGLLHWAGDTRALAEHPVDWSDQRTLGVTDLSALGRGDPWLSSGLPKDGDPIYLSKWETDQATPRLLHIQSIADLELFGISPS